MLGNFSFGDYFKAESIAGRASSSPRATGSTTDRLWVTVFDDDDLGGRRVDGVGLDPVAHRSPRQGRCRRGTGELLVHPRGRTRGPCSEIFVDRGPAYGPEGGPDVDEERFVEILEPRVHAGRDRRGARGRGGRCRRRTSTPAPALERVAMVLQGVDDVFETDLLRPMLQLAEDLSGKQHGEDARDDVSLTVMADTGERPPSSSPTACCPRTRDGATSCAGCSAAWSPTDVGSASKAGDGADRRGRRGRFRRCLPRARGEPGVHRPGLGLRGGPVQRDAAPGDGQAGRRDAAKARSAGTTTVPGDVAFLLSDTHGFPIELTVELLADAGPSRWTRDRFRELLADQRAPRPQGRQDV